MRADRRGIVRGISSRGGRGHGLRRNRDGHGGIDSRAGGAVRMRGAEADIRASVEPRSNSTFGVARSRRTAGRDRSRCGHRAAGDRGIRCGGHYFGGGSGCGLCQLAAAGERKGPCAWACRADYFFDDLDAEVSAAWNMRCAGSKRWLPSVKEVRLDVPTDRTLQAAESYAYHAENVAKNPILYQAETLRRIRSGEQVSAAEYIRRRQELEARRGETSGEFLLTSMFSLLRPCRSRPHRSQI